MSDEARPLSRRERRALEQRQAAGDADATEVLPTAPVSEGAAAISRRERRRLERLARPMETWTAEEEMIATGQFPALTPQAIAEQEALAREKAAEADAEAREAAQLGSTPQVPDAVAPVPERVSTMVTMTHDVASRAPAPMAEGDGAEAEAVEGHAEESPAHEAPDAVVAEPYVPASFAPKPESVFESEPEPEPEPESELDADDDAREPFRGMFPPGSLQATALAARSRGEAAPSAFDKAPFPVAGSPDGADEIRRLTEEAMASLARMSPAYKPEVDATGPIAQVEPVQADGVVATDEDSHTPIEDDTTAPDDAVALDDDEIPGGGPLPEPELVDTPTVVDSFQPSDDGSELEELEGVEEVEEAAPAWETLVHPSDAESDKPIFEPVHPAPAAASAPTVWDTHPLTGGFQVSPVRELEDPSPSADVPRPDLSVLLRDHSASEAAAAAAAYQATESQTTTGSTPVERRVPELQPAGGARHFRWAHLAVIGAIAFVLGVLVWNIIRSNP